MSYNTLGSKFNLQEVFEYTDVIDATCFGTLPLTWRDCGTYHCLHAANLNSGVLDEDLRTYFVYYGPRLGRKVSLEVAASCAGATRPVPENMPNGCDHYEKDEEYGQRDATHDYRPSSSLVAATLV